MLTNYTEGIWGKRFKFSTSTTGSDHFYLDSEKIVPAEYQFNWGLADRSPLVSKGVFTEKSGYTLQPEASGIHFSDMQDMCLWLHRFVRLILLLWELQCSM